MRDDEILAIAMGYTDEKVKSGGSTTKFSATLAANAISVTFTGLPTTGDYLANIYTNDGSNYIGLDSSVEGQVTLTYEAKNVARTVYCELRSV